MGRIYEPEEYFIAKDVNLIDYLTDDGYELIRRGKNFVVITYDELGKKHDSLNISIDGKGWTWYAKGLSSQSSIFLISELDKIEQCYAIRKLADYAQARGLVRAGKIKTEVKEIKGVESEETKEFSLPERNIDNRRVSAYLNKSRGIDYEFINHCIKNKTLYESKEKHNAVFVGSDFDGNSRYACQRGTNTEIKFVGEKAGSDKSYCFRIDGTSDTVRVFESPIDALSYLTIMKMHGLKCKDTMLTLGGTATSALDTYINESRQTVNTIVVCTDNDNAGKKCLDKIQEKYETTYKVLDHRPKDWIKDYNELLLQRLELQKSQKGMER